MKATHVFVKRFTGPWSICEVGDVVEVIEQDAPPPFGKDYYKILYQVGDGATWPDEWAYIGKSYLAPIEGKL